MLEEEIRTVRLQVVVDTNRRTYEGEFVTVESASRWLSEHTEFGWGPEAFLERLDHKDLLSEVAAKICQHPRYLNRASAERDFVDSKLSVVVEAVLDTLREQDQKP